MNKVGGRTQSRYIYESMRILRSEYNKVYYADSGTYKSRGWSEDEEKAIIVSKVSDRELSEKLQRSVRAIQVRRSRIISEGRQWLNPDMIVRKATQPSLA